MYKVVYISGTILRNMGLDLKAKRFSEIMYFDRVKAYKCEVGESQNRSKRGKGKIKHKN